MYQVFSRRIATAHKWIDQIGNISIDGAGYVQEQGVQNGIVSLYKSFFSKEVDWRLRLDDLDFNYIDQLDRDWLGGPFCGGNLGSLRGLNCNKTHGLCEFTSRSVGMLREMTEDV